MSRRGAPVYEEEYYSRSVPPPAPLPVRTREREYEDVDINIRREQERGGYQPDFLREDYGRTSNAGPMVLRERETETFTRPRPRSQSPVRMRERYSESSSSIPPQDYERVRTRMVERERSPSPQLRARVTETREIRRERSPSPVRIRERYIERERSPSPVDRVRIRNIETRRPSPSPSPSPSPPLPPAPIRAPPIHQEIITHHRHIDHGFERVKVPTPPPPHRQVNRTKETDIDIYTSRNHTDVDITRRESHSHSQSRSRTPQPPSMSLARRERETFHDDSYIYEKERDKLRVSDRRVELSRRRSVSARPTERGRVRVDIRDSESESDYYARRANDRAYIGEAYNGATKDWAIVDVPPGTERVRMDGVGGGSQEISWQKYNGVRRSKFIPERERESSRLEIRDDPPPREAARETSTLEIDISSRRRGGGSYEREYERIEESSDRRVGLPRGPPKNRAGDLWTEITKDLVVREAIEELGYDFEETEFFYYIIQYLRYEDVLELVQLSETIRRERQHRIHQIERERESMHRADHHHIDHRRSYRDLGHGGHPHYDDERIVEREIIYDGGAGRRRSGRGGW